MELYLIRHASAYDRDPSAWPDDNDRPPTPQGKKRFRRAARGLRRLAPQVTLVLSSPLVRARQTARILRKEAGWPRAVLSDSLAPDGTPLAVVQALRDLLMGDERHAATERQEEIAEESSARVEEAATDGEGQERDERAAEDDAGEVGEDAEDEDEDRLATFSFEHEAIALVGHEPNLHELASYLLAGDAGPVQLVFKKGGVACLSLPEDVQPGTATLRWLLTPKVLRALRS